MIGLSFKYLTQDNYLEKKATFFGVKSFKENTRNCHKIPVLTPGMRDKRLVMEQKKSQHKSLWLAGVLILDSKLWTEEAVVNLQLVTVWSCGRRAKSGTAPWAPEVSQHERVTRVG